MLPVEQPFKTYTGLDGKPLNDGYIYFGQPNQNPITYPVTVYWDAAGTIPAAQPLRTMNGYILRSGTPANVFFDGSYSETVLDSKRRQVFYARTSDEFSVATMVRNFIASLTASAGSALMGFIQAAAGAVARTVQDELRDIVKPEQFGAKGDGATDDTSAFNKALATGKSVHGKSGATYKLTAGITVNLGLQSFIGNGATLDFSTLTGTQTAITFTNVSGRSPADLAAPSATANVMAGWVALGPGKAGSGAAYTSTVKAFKNYAPHTAVRDCVFYGFGGGVDIFTEGYTQVYDRLAIGQCGLGINIASGGANYGERIVFTNCVVYDSKLAVSNNCQTGAVQFIGCSLDYNLKTLEASNNSVTEFISTWVECNDAGSGNVHVSLADGSILTMHGGRVQQNGTPGALAQAGFLNTAPAAVATFQDVFMFNLQNTANILDSGSGLVSIRGAKSYAVSNLPAAISVVANNKLSDGGFAGSTVQDMWYLNADTAAITDRLTGANTSISLTTAFGRSMPQSLKMTKTAGGAPGGVSLMVPAIPGARVAFTGWYKKPAAASSSGSIFVTTMFARVEGVLASGVPNILVSVNLDTIGIGGTDALIDWTKIGSGMDRIAPSWANAFIVYVNAQPFLGELYFDDFNISSM